MAQAHMAPDSAQASGLILYNTLTRRKEPFRPLDPANVRMYVCGPTVYDHAHIGNARPIIVFDVLYRLLRHLYGASHVAYARNITDVDDKINQRAAQEGVAIGEITARTIARFHEDVSALGCLPPTFEPRATEHIDEMRAMIEALVEGGFAYVAQDHVLFSPAAMNEADGVLPRYGALANRTLDEMLAGARVDVAPYKRDAMDFVLWKPSENGEPSWPSPCGIDRPGRPGWHIECSAMAHRHLGTPFDIHGGGVDLVFPHHENEIAQSCCAFGLGQMAQVWMHNGFLQVEGDKMSKSTGNFVTIAELLADWPGDAIRLNMLKTHYRQPLDWTSRSLEESRRIMADWQRHCADAVPAARPAPEFLEALCDDLNTPRAISVMHQLKNQGDAAGLGRALAMLGLEPRPGAQDAPPVPDARVAGLVAARIEARKAKDWAEADRIRDELVAMGIQIMDGKDPATGELVTEWEVKR